MKEKKEIIRIIKRNNEKEVNTALFEKKLNKKERKKERKKVRKKEI